MQPPAHLPHANAIKRCLRIRILVLPHGPCDFRNGQRIDKACQLARIEVAGPRCCGGGLVGKRGRGKGGACGRQCRPAQEPASCDQSKFLFNSPGAIFAGAKLRSCCAGNLSPLYTARIPARSMSAGRGRNCPAPRTRLLASERTFQPACSGTSWSTQPRPSTRSVDTGRHSLANRR